MLFRTVLLLTVAAASVNGQACESVTWTGAGICPGSQTKKLCIPTVYADAAAYGTALNDMASTTLMTKAQCETAQTLECGLMPGLSANSDYCKDNGGMCTDDMIAVEMAMSCSAASDCDSISRKTFKMMCCSTMRNQATRVCSGYDDSTLDTLVDLAKSLGSCSDDDCVSGASSLSISMALPALLAFFAMFFSRV
mmetsp:Transcript_9603/g.23678  ORF Transcript_9603/g.23678 Transcript_9603/m.23678 type:complete len:195 (+) Transcript_9603:59-643(+)